MAGAVGSSPQPQPTLLSLNLIPSSRAFTSPWSLDLTPNIRQHPSMITLPPPLLSPRNFNPVITSPVSSDYGSSGGTSLDSNSCNSSNMDPGPDPGPSGRGRTIFDNILEDNISLKEEVRYLRARTLEQENEMARLQRLNQCLGSQVKVLEQEVIQKKPNIPLAIFILSEEDYTFHPSFVIRGRAGGKQASQRLVNTVSRSLNEIDHAQTSIRPRTGDEGASRSRYGDLKKIHIMISIYVDLPRLSNRLSDYGFQTGTRTRVGHLREEEGETGMVMVDIVRDFVVGFNSGLVEEGLSDVSNVPDSIFTVSGGILIDDSDPDSIGAVVGPGSKESALLDTFLTNPSCRNVFTTPTTFLNYTDRRQNHHRPDTILGIDEMAISKFVLVVLAAAAPPCGQRSPASSCKMGDFGMREVAFDDLFVTEVEDVKFDSYLDGGGDDVDSEESVPRLTIVDDIEPDLHPSHDPVLPIGQESDPESPPSLPLSSISSAGTSAPSEYVESEPDREESERGVEISAALGEEGDLLRMGMSKVPVIGWVKAWRPEADSGGKGAGVGKVGSGRVGGRGQKGKKSGSGVGGNRSSSAWRSDVREGKGSSGGEGGGGGSKDGSGNSSDGSGWVKIGAKNGGTMVDQGSLIKPDPTKPLTKQVPPPCNFFYLSQGGCHKEKCKFSHLYILKDEELDAMRSGWTDAMNFLDTSKEGSKVRALSEYKFDEEVFGWR